MNDEIELVSTRPGIRLWARWGRSVDGVGLLCFLVKGLRGDWGLEHETKDVGERKVEVTLIVTCSGGWTI